MTPRHVDGMQLLSNSLADSASGNFLELLGKMLHLVMEQQVSQACGAKYGEHCSERLNSRNGYRGRPLETRLGTIQLQIPKLRKGSYLPSFIEPRRRWEKAFVSVVCEAYVHGVSTRKVEDLVEAMGAQGMSKSTVSRMAKSLDASVSEFRNRKLQGSYPYIWLDALYLKVREGTRVVSKAVLVAYAVNEEGGREVIGVDVAQSEMKSCWKRFLERLVERGLSDVQLVISDAHCGLKAAVDEVLNGTTWQRCYVHFLRNLLSTVPRSAQDAVSAVVRNVFRQSDQDAAKQAVSQALGALELKYPKAAELLCEAEEDVLAYMSFPQDHWRQIRSTNPLERLNKEIRRRTNVVGIFPNEASVLRLVGMLLVEQNDEWAVGRRYFSLNSMAALQSKSLTVAGVLEGATS